MSANVTHIVRVLVIIAGAGSIKAVVSSEAGAARSREKRDKPSCRASVLSRHDE